MTNFLMHHAYAAAGDQITNPVVRVQGTSALANYLATFWKAAYILGGLLILVYLILGAIKYLTAGGDEKQITGAKAMITQALIGLLILAASFPIIKAVEIIFGINILQISWPTV